MQTQTVNNKQYNKLLELVREFFPEYNYWWTENHAENTNEYICMAKFKMSVISTSDKTDTFRIHWYQLCLTELPKRIWYKVNRLKLMCTNGNEKLEMCYPYSRLEPSILNSYKHPVDFLYSFVQKCKKNKYFKS